MPISRVRGGQDLPIPWFCAQAKRGGLALFALVLAACDGADARRESARPRSGDALLAQLMVVSEVGAQTVVSDPESLTRAERFADTLDAATLLRRDTTRRERADSLPWLIGSETGRRFLAAGSPRALARGAPADACPASGVASAEDLARPGAPPPRRAEVARRALELCLDALPRRPDTESCGCELLALDNVVTVPREELAYATGVTARVEIPALGLDGVLVAEDEPGGGALLRGLAGDVGRLARLGENRARLTLVHGGGVFEGRREAVGFRRGRLAERLYLTDPAGRRAVVLIGFPPAELAESAGAALAWPSGG